MNKIVSPSPHIHSPLSTKRLMLDVIYALMPAVILSCLLYGWKELLLLVVSVVSCVGLEYLINRFLLKKPSTIADHSAVVTGILLALNVPVSCPWWVMVIGAVIAIGVVKMTFGGLGQNIFNPAIAARVFLLLSFPVYMTDWAYTPTALFSNIDAVSGPTLLGVLNEQGISALGKLDWRMLLINTCGGSAGELSAVALLAGFVYLLCRKVIKPWITLSILGTVAIFALVLGLVQQPAMGVGEFIVFNLLTGGLLLGSIFMATDYVTSPMSDWGGVVYGIGIGLLTMLIRYYGAYPEGVSFAILIMNMTVPLINRAFHQRKYGRKWTMAMKSTFKNMVICLTLICIVCSALLAGVYALTEAPIKKAAADKLNSAISEVLPEFSSLSEEKSIEFNGKTYSYYEVADSAANVLGYAVKAAVGGFGGPVSLMVGVLTDGTIYNTKVLSHSETPGLGAKCTESAFADQFKGFDPSVKKLSVKKDGGDIDAITAATITSRAYAETVALAVAVSEAVRGVNVEVEDVIDAFDGASSAVNNGGPEK